MDPILAFAKNPGAPVRNKFSKANQFLILGINTPQKQISSTTNFKPAGGKPLFVPAVQAAISLNSPITLNSRHKQRFLSVDIGSLPVNVSKKQPVNDRKRQCTH
jgi:hypothetical protein